MSYYTALFGESLRQSGINFKKLFHFDSIQLHKIMEISQYSIMAFCFALLGAAFVNNLAKPHRPELQNMPTLTIFWHIMRMTLIIVILSRYIPKIVRIFPFLFWFDPRYAPGFKGENMFGINAAMGLAFFTCIYNYYDFMAEFSYRIFPKTFEYQGGTAQFCNKKGEYTVAYPTCTSFGAKRMYYPGDS